MGPWSAMLPRSMMLLPCLLLLAMTGTASTIEESTGHAVSYQFDAGSHHDAPDACPAATSEWSLPVDGGVDGLLVAPDDVADAFTVDVPRSLLGKRLSLSVAEPTGAQELLLDAFVPGCGGSILDLVNWPTPEPTPPAPAPGESQLHPASLTPEHCEPRKWVFLLDGLAGLPAPDSIHVAWTDGSERTIPLWQSSPQHAVYPTDLNRGITLKGAWANLPSAYTGSFRLVLGPCDTLDGGAVYGGPPTLAEGLLSFTPTRAGTHVVLVSFAGVRPLPDPAEADPTPLLPVQPEDLAGQLSVGASSPPKLSVEGLLATVDPADPASALPRVVVPASCHYCVAGLDEVVERIGYRLDLRRAT